MSHSSVPMRLRIIGPPGRALEIHAFPFRAASAYGNRGFRGHRRTAGAVARTRAPALPTPANLRIARFGLPCFRVALAALVEPGAEGVLPVEVGVGGGPDDGGRARPPRCHSRQPSIAHCEDAGPLSLELLGQLLVALVRPIVTVNGIRWNRRRIASSTERRPGLWLPAISKRELRRRTRRSPAA